MYGIAPDRSADRRSPTHSCSGNLARVDPTLRRLIVFVLIGGLFAAVVLWTNDAIDKAKPTAPTTTSQLVGDHPRR
jgi:hypothetical protein